MKKFMTLLTFCFCLVTLIIGSSCSSVDNFQNDFLKIVPTEQKNYMSAIDVKSLRNDDDLSSIYSQFSDGFNTSQEYGFDLNNVDYLSLASGNSGALILMKGKISENDVKSQLGNLGYGNETYEGFELWTNESESSTMAFTPLGFIVGDSKETVMNSIRSLKKIDESLYANKDAKGLMNKAGKGLIVIMSLSENLGSQYAGANGFVVTFGKMNKGNFTIRGIYQFANEGQTKNAVSSIKNDLPNSFANSQWDMSKVIQSGNSVIFQGTWRIQDFDFGAFGGF